MPSEWSSLFVIAWTLDRPAFLPGGGGGGQWACHSVKCWLRKLPENFGKRQWAKKHTSFHKKNIPHAYSRNRILSHCLFFPSVDFAGKARYRKCENYDAPVRPTVYVSYAYRPYCSNRRHTKKIFRREESSLRVRSIFFEIYIFYFTYSREIAFP